MQRLSRALSRVSVSNSNTNNTTNYGRDRDGIGSLGSFVGNGSFSGFSGNINSYNFSNSRYNRDGYGQRDSVSDMLLAMFPNKATNNNNTNNNNEYVSPRVTNSHLITENIPEEESSSPSIVPTSSSLSNLQSTNNLYMPTSVSAALVSGLSSVSSALAIGISVPTTDARSDNNGNVYTVFGIRVALAGGNLEPWTVWRRYRQFDELHKILSRKFSGISIPGNEDINNNDNNTSPNRINGSSLLENNTTSTSSTSSLELSTSTSLYLPELPGKGSGWNVGNAMASALGVIASRGFVEERRAKLEIYLRQLVKVPAVWACEEFISFLDNDTRTLATQCNYMRMLAAQRMLTHVTVTNVRRTRAIEKRVNATHAVVDSLNRKMERLEALLLENRGNDKNNNTNNYNKGIMNNTSNKSVTTNTTSNHNATNNALNSNTKGPIISDYFSSNEENRNRTKSTEDTPLANDTSSVDATAKAYVETYARMKQMQEKIDREQSERRQSLYHNNNTNTSLRISTNNPPLPSDNEGTSSSSISTPMNIPINPPVSPLASNNIPAGFRSSGTLLAAEVTNSDTMVWLDWLFGNLNHPLNAPHPLDDSASSHRLAVDERIPPELVDAHKRALQERNRIQANELGLGGVTTGNNNTTIGADGRKGYKNKNNPRNNVGMNSNGTNSPNASLGISGASTGIGYTASSSMTLSPPFIQNGRVVIPIDYALVPEISATGKDSLDPNDALSPLFQDPILKLLADRIDALLACIEPTPAADSRRTGIVNFTQNLIKKSIGTEAFTTGSTTTKLYLPNGDIDITTFLPGPPNPNPNNNNTNNLALNNPNSFLMNNNNNTASSTNGTNNATNINTNSNASANSSNNNNYNSLTATGTHNDWFVRVNESLCVASMTNNNMGNNNTANNNTIGSQTALANKANSFGNPRYPVRNVAFINADVRIVRCTVGNTPVDISANQSSALAAAALVESCDRWIGRNHLLKRSILLIKAWCELESADFTSANQSILNSGNGGMSSYALTLLIIALFNSHDRVIRHPFHALVLFFEEYADTLWGSHLITLHGPRHLFTEMSSTPQLQRPAAPRFITNDYLRPFRLYTACCVPRENLEFPFDVRNVNILDPVAHWNNLGRSVSRKGAAALSESLKIGRDRLRYLLRISSRAGMGTVNPQVPVQLLDNFFLRTLNWYGRGDGWREDLLTHPMEKGGVTERASRLAGAYLPQQPTPPHPLLRMGDAEMSTDPLAGDVTTINYALSYSAMLLSGNISAPALVALAVQLLHIQGPMPVGEVGKCLQEITGNTALPALIKEYYGGLKKFLEAHHNIFRLANDHPFNPAVLLQDGIIQ